MDLILWRHAEAEDGANDADDMVRSLTRRGEKQAARMGRWLDTRLPDTTRVLVSPARRCEQTVMALGRKYRICEEIRPDGLVQDLLTLAQWPSAKQAVLVVGHQPTLGQTVSELLGLEHGDCPVRKGSVWWLRFRSREEGARAVVVTVQTPDFV